MGPLIVGLLFLIPGLAFFFYIITKYTEDKHKKELEKWRWVREDKFASMSEADISLFHRIGSKSFIAAKVIMIVISLFPIVIGAFALWVYFGS